MKVLLMVTVAFFLCGCSYSVNLVHSEGTASDIIDESQSPQTTLPAGLDGIIKKLQG